MSALSLDEQQYLQAAFIASPQDWFRPRTVSFRDFSDREIDKIVGSLSRQGMMDAEPECHARLTERGRREAEQLGKLAKRDWCKFYKRRKTRIIVASVAGGFCIALVVLKSTGLI